METYITVESRMSIHNPSVAKNYHEIVINKLIEIWETEPDESFRLFTDIAERILKYENPKTPKIYWDKSKSLFLARDFHNGKKTHIGSSKDYETVVKKIKQWLRFNR